jgi:8-oxo-dGTP diphosphatase
MNRARTGDGFMRCSDGHIRWGLFGAAGVVFVMRQPAGPLVMLQKRSMRAHEGGTWSCAGGALGMGESALAGALREAAEEVGEIPAHHRVLGHYVFTPCDDWHYTTVVVEVQQLFGDSVNFETDAVQWFGLDEVERLEVHEGFETAWPHLRAIIEQPPAVDAGW